MPRVTLLVSILGVAGLIFVGVIPLWTAPAPFPKPQPKEITNSIGMRLVLIKSGKFMMGSAADQKDRGYDEHPHEVEITKAFFMGVYPVTQKEYKAVMGSNPSFFSVDGGGTDKVKGVGTSKFPVEQVSWVDAVQFCEKLTGLPKEKEAGRQYRLPTEAEWEYACRAGTKTRYNTGDDEDDLKKAAWYRGNNSYWRTHTVGKKKANAWGLYDMHGNVSQWCSDWFDEDYYQKSAKKDPKGPESGDGRIVRGGAWYNFPWECRAACRGRIPPGELHDCQGFRVVCVQSGK